MLKNPLSPDETVFLPIDIQWGYVRNLSHRRQKRFPAGIKIFADYLKERGIPTIWVAWGERNRFDYYPPRLAPHLSNEKVKTPETLQDLMLTCCPVEETEGVFVKGTNSAFESPLLAETLEQQNRNTVLIAGMNTCSCIWGSVQDAIKSGLRCIVVCDLLADDKGLIRDVSPRAHAKWLAANLSDFALEKVELTTRRSLMKALPAPPLRQTPGRFWPSWLKRISL